MSRHTLTFAAEGETKQATATAPDPHAIPALQALIDETEALKRVPVARRTWYDWRQRGLIPYIRLPGAKRLLYHWPSVEAALLRMQRGGAV